MSWDEGEPTGRRSRRTPIVIAGIVVAVLALGLLTRQATPEDRFDIETEQPTVADPAEPSLPAVSEPPVESGFPRDTGLTLWVINGQGELLRVNLDTGETAQARVLEGRSDTVDLLPGGDGVVVTSMTFSEEGDAGQARYVTSLEVPPIVLGPAAQALPSPTPGRVWLMESSPFFPSVEPVRLREVSFDGMITSEMTLPAGVSAHAAVEGGLLVNTTGSVVIYDPATQQGRSIADGTVLVADSRRLLRRICDEELRCRAAMGTLEVPDAANVTLPPEVELAMVTGFSQATLSPTGRWIALVVFDPASGDQPRLAILDVTNGELRAAPDPIQLGDQALGPFASHFAWAPSGEWLFAVDDEGGVTAWNVLDDRLAPIDLDLVAPAAIAVS